MNLFGNNSKWEKHIIFIFYSGKHMLLRNANGQDSGSILNINSGCLPGVAELDQKELDRLLLNAAFFRIAELYNTIAAYLIAFTRDSDYDGQEFLRFRDNQDNFLYIDQVAVSKHSRRRGIATELYRDAIEFASVHRIDRLCCEVNIIPPNPGSMEFHYRLAFIRTGTMTTVDQRTVALFELDLVKNNHQFD